MFYSILQPAPYPIQIDDNRGAKVVSVPIATDDERVVAVVSTLESFVRDDEEMFEFSFEIVVVGIDSGGEEFRTQDRNMAAPYIPGDARPHVMPIVCASLNALVLQEKPDTIFMVTKDRNLPVKAMPKYDALMDTLYASGFHVAGEGTDLAGRRFWTMRRV